MYSILKKFKQILLYGGLEKQQYKQISARIDDANRKSIVILSLSCLLFFLVRLSLSYSQVPMTNRIAFSCSILLFALLAICNVRIKNRQWVVHLSAYLNARAEEIRKLNEDLAKSQKELQKALSAAEQANHAKTTFLNNMSHDIEKNPRSGKSCHCKHSHHRHDSECL